VAAAAFIVPFMFVYGPELLLIGEPLNIVLAIITALIGVACLSAGLAGWMLLKLNILERLLILVAAFLLMHSGWVTDMVGLGTALLVFLAQRSQLAKILKEA